MVKPSLAQNRLGGPPTEVPIPSNLPHAVELCSSSLSSSLFKNPKPCVSAFGAQATGPTRPRSCTWMLKNKSRISSNCSFQISRVSNQNRLHLCHDRLWSSGDVCILVIQRPQQLEKGFLSSPGHNPSQPLVTVSSLATLPSSPCISLGILLSDGVQCLPCPDLRACEFSKSRSLTPWPRGATASPRPRMDTAASGGRARPRRGGRAAAEVRRLRGGDGRFRSQTPELSQPWELRRGGERMPFTCLQHLSKWILFLSLQDVSGIDISDKYDSMSCLSGWMMFLVWTSVTIRWVACLVVLCSSSMKVPTQVCWVRSLLLSEYHLCPHSNSTMKDDWSVSMDQG